MKSIECNICGHKETVNNVFYQSIKIGSVKCTNRRACKGNMKIVGD